ncbi:glycosyltransferase family 4 protein [Aeromicrobium sp.]|nr:glycosyltransferase family 4 protein [Candidatus Saccharibacteria bacterium]
MRVLMLGWELPPHNSGGLGVACYHLCKALAKKPVDIEFILPYHAPFVENFMKVTAAHPQGAKVVMTNSGAYDSYKYVFDDGHEEHVDIVGQQMAFEDAVARIASSKEYDVIHAHDWLTFRAALRAKQAKMHCPLILHVHSIERDRAGGQTGNPLVREIEATSMLVADKIIAVSQLTKDAIIEEYGIPADKIDVVHNSVDHTTFEALDADNAYNYLVTMKSNGYRVVTNVGRLTVQKGLTNFLLAAKEVINRAPRTFFLIVGSGEQYFELIELAAKLGIAENVIFTGFQRGKNWRDSFAIADLFVMPSISEPFGIAPLESVGFGTPTLISNQSGVKEVLHNTLKVDFWDVHEMANQITAVVQNDALRDTLQANASAELNRMSWDHTADKLFSIYQHHMQKVTA